MTRHFTSLKYVSLATASSLSFRSCPEALALNPVFCFCFFAKNLPLSVGFEHSGAELHTLKGTV